MHTLSRKSFEKRLKLKTKNEKCSRRHDKLYYGKRQRQTKYLSKLARNISQHICKTMDVNGALKYFYLNTRNQLFKTLKNSQIVTAKYLKIFNSSRDTKPKLKA